jgi:hypothetical protein
MSINIGPIAAMNAQDQKQRLEEIDKLATKRAENAIVK